MRLRKTHMAALMGIVALAVAACGGSSSSSGSSTSAAASSGSAAESGGATSAGGSAAPGGSTAGALTIRTGASLAPALTEQAAKFTAENGVPVNVQVVAGDDVQGQFVTASQAGTGPDLI